MKYLSLLLLTTLLAACTGNTDSELGAEYNATEVPTGDNDAVTTTANPAATLQATNDAVQANSNDITTLPGDAAISNIDTWIDQLDDVDGANKVTANLETLRDALQESPINGELAGMLLITLAEDTRQVGGSTPGISTLVAALKAGGEKLTSGVFFSSSLLDQTLKAVKDKAVDITTLPVATATANIDSWIDELRGIDDTDGMIEELQSLKAELMAPSIDGEKVSEIMYSLADDTREMAGENKSLAVLAYALEAGGARLDGKDD